MKKNGMENMDNYENPKLNYNIVITIGISAFFAMLNMFAAGVAFAFKAFIFSVGAAVVAFLFLMAIILELKYYEEKWNRDYKSLSNKTLMERETLRNEEE